MKKKVLIITLGCAKNTCDSENMAYLLTQGGFELTESSDSADFIVINTCGFIEAAKTESVEVILDAVSCKEKNPNLKICICGCLSQRYSRELFEEIPEADYILGTMNMYDIAKILSGEETTEDGGKIYLKDKNSPIIEAGRIPSQEGGYAYIKIAEGCNRNCTYCAIPLIRGVQRSRTMESVIGEAKELSQKEGKSELILVAQDTGEYGTDLYQKRMIAPLIEEIAKIDEVKRIRLLYVYPEAIDDELIELYSKCEKLAHYIDIPFQHISDGVLRKMARRTSKAEITQIIDKLRKAIPDIAIRSTFIAGFPGESAQENQELADFLRQYRITRAGVFVYSPEEGTPAARMTGQIEEEEKQRRRDYLMEVQMEVSSSVMEGFIGKNLEVMVEEEIEDGYYSARSYMDSPDVDGAVYFTSRRKLKAGDWVEVYINDSTEYDLWGIAE